MTHAQRGFTGRSITELTAFESTQTTLSIRQFGSRESIRLKNFILFFFAQFIKITINIRIDNKLKITIIRCIKFRYNLNSFTIRTSCFIISLIILYYYFIRYTIYKLNMHRILMIIK